MVCSLPPSGRMVMSQAPFVPPGAGAFRPRVDFRAPVGRIPGIEHHQPRILHPAVGILIGMGKFRLQRLAGHIAVQVDAARRRQDLAPAEMVIKEKPEADEMARPQALVMRQHEAQRPDDVRRRLEQHLALDQRLAHQAEFIMLEIAQAAMDQLGGGRGRAGGQVALFGEEHLQAPPRRITRNAAAIDAAADDEQIINHSAACIVES